jgi:hypothetical protein
VRPRRTDRAWRARQRAGPTSWTASLRGARRTWLGRMAVREAREDGRRASGRARARGPGVRVQIGGSSFGFRSGVINRRPPSLPSSHPSRPLRPYPLRFPSPRPPSSHETMTSQAPINGVKISGPSHTRRRLICRPCPDALRPSLRLESSGRRSLARRPRPRPGRQDVATARDCLYKL